MIAHTRRQDCAPTVLPSIETAMNIGASGNSSHPARGWVERSEHATATTTVIATATADAMRRIPQDEPMTKGIGSNHIVQRPTHAAAPPRKLTAFVA